MVSMLALFPADADPDQLEAYVSGALLPTLRAAPGVAAVSTSRGPVMSPAGPSPHARIVLASFVDLAAVMGFAQSPETGDVRRRGEELGVEVYMFESGE